MQGPFADGPRQWARKTMAKIAASTASLGAGELLVDEQGNVYGGNGGLVSGLKRLIRVDEVAGKIVDPGSVGSDGGGFDGQSNGAARATGADTVRIDVPDPRLRVFAAAGPYAGMDSMLVAPTSSNYPDAGILNDAPGVGVDFEMGRRWLRRIPNNRNFTAITAAFGGTPFEGNDSRGLTRVHKVGATGVTTNLTDNMIAQCKAFLALNPKNKIRFVYFAHGEQDGSNDKSATYKQNCLDYIDYVRAQLGDPTLPILFAPMTYETVNGASRIAIDAIQKDLPIARANVAFVQRPDEPGYGDPVNGGITGIHYGLAMTKILAANGIVAVDRAVSNVMNTAPITPTAAPTFKQTANTAGTIGWTLPMGRQTAFVVQMDTGSGYATVARTPTAALDPTQPVTGLVAGSTVKFRYAVVNELGQSGWSPELTVTLAFTPNAPSAAAVGFVTNTTAVVSVTDGAVDANHGATKLRNLQRSSDGGATFDVVAFRIASTTYVDTGLTPGTTYVWKWVAFGDAGFGGTSPTATATTTATAPFLTDQFTGAAGTSLAAHAPDVGGAWTVNAGSAIITDANRMRIAGTTTTLATNAAAPPTANVAVSQDVVVLSSIAGSQIGVYVRASGTTVAGFSGYGVRWLASAAAWQLVKWVNGATTVLASLAAAPAAGETHNIVVKANGTTISGTVDGVQIGSVTDNAIAAAGSIAVIGGGATAPSNTTGMHLDNLQAAA